MHLTFEGRSKSQKANVIILFRITHPRNNTSAAPTPLSLQPCPNFRASWVGKIPWRRKWQPAPKSLPRESHPWRSLESYGPGGHRESDTHAHDLCLSQKPYLVFVASLYFTDWTIYSLRARNCILCLFLFHTASNGDLCGFCLHMRAQPCLIVCEPMEGSPAGSSVQEILQAKIQE